MITQCHVITCVCLSVIDFKNIWIYSTRTSAARCLKNNRYPRGALCFATLRSEIRANCAAAEGLPHQDAAHPNPTTCRSDSRRVTRDNAK